MKYLKKLTVVPTAKNMDDLKEEYPFVSVATEEENKVTFGNYSYFTVKYNIPSAGTYDLFGNRTSGAYFGGISQCVKMYVNDVEVAPSLYYTFTESGKYTVKLVCNHTISTLERLFDKYNSRNTNAKPLSMDFRHLDTREVNTTASMLQSCYNLASIGDLSKWNTSNVIDMNRTFNQCYVLTSVGDLSNWDVSKVTNMRSMFNQCYNLSFVGDLSSWNTSKVTNMYMMFCYCRNLKSVGNISNWDMSHVTTVQAMFAECYSLTELDLSGWNLSAVTDTTLSIFPNITGSSDRRNGDLKKIILGQGYFNAPTTEYYFNDLTCINWSHDSMMESLYTNQVGRDTTNTKTVHLSSAQYDKLSEDEIAQIATVGLEVIRDDDDEN